MSINIYQQDLEKCAANFEQLSPLSFIRRSAQLYPHREAVVHGARALSWSEVYSRFIRLASALINHGIGPGDTVAAMLPNIPEMYEAHFGVPMAGAVLNAINTRLDASTIAFILEHAEAKVLLTDREFSATIKETLAQISHEILVIDVDDVSYEGGELLGNIDYEALLEQGDPEFEWQMPGDEWDAISLNYTSGTTGDPKALVYHHRGAYLNAVNNALSWEMDLHPRYLWTLPMFHCTGWCFPWTLAAVVGTTLCLRQVRDEPVFTAFKEQGVTHFCGAPIVLNMLINAADDLKEGLPTGIRVMTAGAATPVAVI
jgi:fatty-acyl-CoA synthase